MSARRIRRSARGAAAVEFAIVLPVLLVLLLGTIDWGYYFFVRETVVHAAREGARSGTLVPPNLDPAPDARDAAEKFLTSASLKLARADVTAGASPAGDSVWVEIHYETGSITGFLGSLMPEEAVARAEMRW